MIQRTSDTPLSVKTLQVTGPDAAKFLQGQLTCDVNALQDGDQTLGAYCNIKGKVESLFTLRRTGDSYFMYLQPGLLESTAPELKKYAVFSKVELSLADQPALNINEAQAIEQKIPELYIQTVGAFFPHDINLPALGAVSFTKGCYRGQEIVARMQHRGNLKRSMYKFNITDAQVNPGDIVTTADKQTPAGTVVRVCNVSAEKIMGLAVLNDALKAQELYINSARVYL